MEFACALRDCCQCQSGRLQPRKRELTVLGQADPGVYRSDVPTKSPGVMFEPQRVTVEEISRTFVMMNWRGFGGSAESIDKMLMIMNAD